MALRFEQQIRKTFNVVSTSGDEFLCRCPWHIDGMKPNLYANGRNGKFLCQSCGKRGHMEGITGMMPQASAQDLRDRLGALTAPKAHSPRIYSEEWLQRFQHTHPAWYDRGFSEEVMTAFNLGYDPIKDVLTIPVRNMDGDVLGVITRRLDDQKPKYMYPKGFPIGKYLFGAWKVAASERHTVALVEGTIDCVACWDARVPAMAMMGSRLTKDQRTVMQELGVRTAVIFTDNDGPGREAIIQVQEALRGTGIAVRVAGYRPYWRVQTPLGIRPAKDPAELNEQRRRKAYHSAVPWHRWIEMGC